jgi:hypothetical protein
VKHVHGNSGCTVGTSSATVCQGCDTTKHGTKLGGLCYVLILATASGAGVLSFLGDRSRAISCCACAGLLEIVHQCLDRAVIEARLAIYLSVLRLLFLRLVDYFRRFKTSIGTFTYSNLGLLILRLLRHTLHIN